MLRTSSALVRGGSSSVSAAAVATAVSVATPGAARWASSVSGPATIHGIDEEVIELELFNTFDHEPSSFELDSFARKYAAEIEHYRHNPIREEAFTYRMSLNLKYTTGRDVLFARWDNEDLPLTHDERDRLDALEAEHAKRLVQALSEKEVSKFNSERRTTDPLKRKEEDAALAARKAKGLSESERKALRATCELEHARKTRWASWVKKNRQARVDFMKTLPQVEAIEIEYRTLKPLIKVGTIPTVDQMVAQAEAAMLKTPEDKAREDAVARLQKAITPKQKAAAQAHREMVDRRFAADVPMVAPNWTALRAASSTPWVVDWDRKIFEDFAANRPSTVTEDQWKAWEDARFVDRVFAADVALKKRRIAVENQVVLSALSPKKWWRDVTLEDELLQYPEIAKEIKDEIEAHNWYY